MDTKVLSALAEPNRLRIVELLKERPRSVNEIAEALDLRQPQASKHLHFLSKAGFVYMQPVAQKRIYSLSPTPFIELNDWINSFAKFWDERLTALGNYLEKE